MDFANSSPNGALDDTETVYEAFYPGDNLSDRAVKMVTAILAERSPELPAQPGPIIW